MVSKPTHVSDVEWAEHEEVYGKKGVIGYGVDGSDNAVSMLVDSEGKLQVDTLGGLEVPAHNYIALTYVSAGNGAGEIETVTYKTGGVGGTTVATLTLAYNASNELSSVTKS